VLIGPVNNRVIGSKHTVTSAESVIGCNNHVKLATREISQNKLRIWPEVYGWEVEAFHWLKIVKLVIKLF